MRERYIALPLPIRRFTLQTDPGEAQPIQPNSRALSTAT